MNDMTSKLGRAGQKEQALHEGNYSAVCRIVVECIARPLTSAFSRIINSYLVLPKGKR